MKTTQETATTIGLDDESARAPELGKPLLDAFDAIFCINLDRRPDRWRRVTTEFRRIGIDTAVERIPAVELPNPARGCCFSHIKCAQIARERGLSHILVFEDDVEFDLSIDPTAVRNAIAAISDADCWEIFHLGGRMVSRARKVCRNVYSTRVYSTHAYAMNRSVFRKVLEARPAIDVWYSMHCRQYCISPLFATQAADFSDIAGQTIDWKTSAFRRSYTLRTGVRGALVPRTPGLSLVRAISGRTKKRMKSLKGLVDNKVAGRTVLPDDTYLVSFPKSGNTWIRYMLTRLVSEDSDPSLNEMNSVVPDMYHFNDAELLSLGTPRIIKSHEGANRKYPKVVYIVRDPRSVLVSLFYYHIKIRTLPEEFPIRDFVPRFLKGVGMKRGRWGGHVTRWIEERAGDDSFLLVRYEDLLRDGVAEMKKVCEFIGFDRSAPQIAAAVTGSDIETLRAKEQAEGWSSTLKSEDSTISFFRRGAPDEWKHVLDDASREQVESSLHAEMQTLGYLP